MNPLKFFGTKMFSDEVMQDRLPHEIYKSLKKSIDLFLPLDPKVAPIVAAAMKDWAIQHGATHYTHWFQPINGLTAGKHESFISLKNSKICLEFSGKELIKGEPDASSFPNGGLRNTFEARGYTTWDCTSPAFIKGRSLYIPTAFCSYNGEALDTKTPLLKSMEVVSNAAIKILKAFGDTTTKRIIVNVGAEQEYFLINRENYEKRLDLKVCGRTLFGMKPPKDQEMDSHYCGRIRIKVSKFMNELDKTLWTYGICAKTRHNEVAPAQHEIVPLFESCNVAADHNQLIMNTMRTIAKKNGLACLLHEKPFKHVNGSGKHLNWSLSKMGDSNLFSAGDSKKDYIQFLIFICSVIRGVDTYAGLIRLSAASATNDLRLGGKEAPPAIMSIFLGDHILNILNEIATGNFDFTDKLEDILITDVKTLPNLPKDASDRNRTSPFAFTGNKFEFRMLGSSASISFATTIINLVVAESLEYFAKIIDKETSLKSACKKIIAETMQKHSKIIFNGNSYSTNWKEEAKSRGLCNITNALDAAEELIKENNLKLFEHFDVLSKQECDARYKILISSYKNTIEMEAHTMIEMIDKEIIPTIISYLNKLSQTYLNLQSCKLENKQIFQNIESINKSVESILRENTKLKLILEKIDNISSDLEKAKLCRDDIIKQMENLQKEVNYVEQFIPKNEWNIPSIIDLLYRV